MTEKKISEYEKRLGYAPGPGCLNEPILIQIQHGSDIRDAYIVRRGFGHTIQKEAFNRLGCKEIVILNRPKIDVDVPCKTGGHDRLVFPVPSLELPSKVWKLTDGSKSTVLAAFEKWKAKRDGD